MLVLDTNMLSEIMRPEPERKVADWIVRQQSEELFTAAVCQAEILSGLAVMPSGRRRTELEEAARAMFTDDFDGRVLPFDIEAASAYAKVFAARRNAGRPSGTIDLMLAAIARARGASVVTRNVADFEGVGVAIINPWDE
ncbi:MAG: type II toxin-antitoxin system VapC family toxin [Rhodospirillales bacterium]|jgi:predicted nucleic acid-binding protein|nr:type II toxin-antitoxin system VapC family toxin [Rhodospirillales bacterium]MBN8904907.1 type II toxin-antitoxin system VapC family toxin [Rhodospirillales bacterium]MBN8928481.1 type II toxin-antitoxin system VapC family toxin [Rhodospirillales bacterium]